MVRHRPLWSYDQTGPGGGQAHREDYSIGVCVRSNAKHVVLRGAVGREALFVAAEQVLLFSSQRRFAVKGRSRPAFT